MGCFFRVTCFRYKGERERERQNCPRESAAKSQLYLSGGITWQQCSLSFLFDVLCYVSPERKMTTSHTTRVFTYFNSISLSSPLSMSLSPPSSHKVVYSVHCTNACKYCPPLFPTFSSPLPLTSYFA